jgi:hypothetical protein
MTDPEQPSGDERVLVRWLPSVLLDLAPSEPVVALRTPHRVSLQALPTSSQALAALLGRSSFELTLELETDSAPLRHAPVHEVHEARLTPDLPLAWVQYYWLTDELLGDLAGLAIDPAAALMRGRMRLAVVENALRTARGLADCDLDRLVALGAELPAAPAPDVERHGEPTQALQQYVRGLSGHLIEHAASRDFAAQASELAQFAERRPDLGLPNLGAGEIRMLSMYLQHRLLGGAWLTAPAGMIAGWHLLLSSYVLAVWWAGLRMASKKETRLRDAVLRSLGMLDQGLWRDEPLLHDVLRHLNASEYASAELASALTAALRGAHARA